MSDSMPPIPSMLPPAPGAYEPIWRDQRKIDDSHLRLLSIFHYVLAGLGVLFLGFLLLHYVIMHTVFTNPKMWQNGNTHNTPPPPELFAMFKWFYLFFGVMIVVGMTLNIVSGWCIARRQGRMFSLIIAGMNCLQVPFGTTLGVFTLVVLLRDSVREGYEAAAARLSTS